MKASMKYIVFSLLSFFLAFSACDNAKTKVSENNVDSKDLGAQPSQKEVSKLLRHVVLFNFQDTTSEENIVAIETAFVGLSDKIPEIYDLEWGLNNSPEGLDKGFTHCFFLSFLSEKDRATYLPHPAHQDFVAFIGPFVEDVTVVDYWTQ